MVKSQLKYWYIIMESKGQLRQYVQGEEFIHLPIIFSEVHTQKTFHHYQKCFRGIYKNMVKGINKLWNPGDLSCFLIWNIYLTIATCFYCLRWTKFSKMKMIQTRSRNCTGESSLNNLMVIATVTKKLTGIEFDYIKYLATVAMYIVG